jgi:hypothetical protein
MAEMQDFVIIGGVGGSRRPWGWHAADAREGGRGS